MSSKSHFRALVTGLIRFKKLFLALAIGFTSLGVIGGCNSNDGGDDASDAVFIGGHEDQIRRELGTALDIGEYDGLLNNVILDCLDLENLTQEERDIVKAAYEQGFVIIAYDANENCVARLYSEVLRHFRDHADVESFDDIPEGASHDIFAIETHGIHVWTAQTVFERGNIPAVVVELPGLPPASALNSAENPFSVTSTLEGESPVFEDTKAVTTYEDHSSFISDWIRAHDERKTAIEAEGIVLTEFLNANPDMVNLSAEKSEVSTRGQSDQTGTLGDIAASWHNTFTYHPAAPVSNPPQGVYTMTSYVWAITADGTSPSGIYSYIFVAEDFNLQSSNLVVDTDGRHKGWYLLDFLNVNNIQTASGTNLTPQEAVLLDNDPQTEPGSSEQETISTGGSVSGDINSDGPSVGAEANWQNSVTIQKAEVAINNLSLSRLGNDASFEYLPRRSEPQDRKGCNQNHLSGPAALSESNFQPSQSFIYQIDPKFAGKTVKLRSAWRVTLRYDELVNGVNYAACTNYTHRSLETDNLGEPDQYSAVFYGSFSLPPVPE